MATGVTVWSKTAATNSGSDSNVNWSEGQSAPSVNNSARAEMASVAMWRDDLNGTLTTGGTSTAYTLTTNQVFAALTAGYEVAFTVNAANGTPVTLNVDGLGAKPLRANPNVALPAGALAIDTIHRATYKSSNGGEWILQAANPAASGSVAGIVELASDAETITGTATDRALTPANLRSMSGTYTPVITEVTNCTGGTAISGAFRWSRIGDIVNVNGQLSVDPTAAGTTELRITLPVSTTLASAAALSGSGSSSTTAALGTSCSVTGLTTGGANQAVINFSAVSTANQAFPLIFGYIVA
jgi:hypothetical protein